MDGGDLTAKAWRLHRVDALGVSALPTCTCKSPTVSTHTDTPGFTKENFNPNVDSRTPGKQTFHLQSKLQKQQDTEG